MKTVIVLLILSFVALCYSFPFARGAGGRGGGMNFAALAAMDIMELQDAMAMRAFMRRQGPGANRRSPLANVMMYDHIFDPPEMYTNMALMRLGAGGAGAGAGAGGAAAGK